MGAGLWLPLKKGYEDNHDSVITPAHSGDADPMFQSDVDNLVCILASHFSALGHNKKQTWSNCCKPGTSIHEAACGVPDLKWQTAEQVAASIPGYRGDACVLFCNSLYVLLLHIDNCDNFHIALVVREGAPAFAKGNLWAKACRIWEHLQREGRNLFRRDTAYTMRQAVFSAMPLPGSTIKTKPTWAFTDDLAGPSR